jgi:hypothetical protein
MVRANSSGTTVYTHGVGGFAAGDYAIACLPISYGDVDLYIPDTSKLFSVISVDDDAEEMVISGAESLEAGMFLLNLGADSAASLGTPAYDGGETLYTDPVGNATAGLPYLRTSQGGEFRGWLTSGTELVDLLLSDESGVPQVVIPGHAPGPEVVR